MKYLFTLLFTSRVAPTLFQSEEDISVNKVIVDGINLLYLASKRYELKLRVTYLVESSVN